MTVTLAKDLRELFGEVRDQAARPTCLACAVSDAHAAVYKPLHPLSVEYLFYHGVQRMHARNPRCGISMKAASHVLPNEGQPVEADWPYLDVLPADLSTWSPPVKCEVYRRVLPQNKLTVEQMCAAMDDGHPVVVVLRVTNSFYSPDANGVVVEPLVDPFAGKHAVVAVGHGHLTTKKYVLVRNSWGATWGVDGYAFLEKDYLDKRVIETAVIA